MSFAHGRRLKRQMPSVRLHGPLAARAAGGSHHAADGATVGEVLEALERARPGLRGWLLDERRRLRPHLAAFVGGEAAGVGTPVAAGDRVDVVQAISGG